jgi:hypothetical protein
MKRPELLGKSGTAFGCLNVGCAGTLVLAFGLCFLTEEKSSPQKTTQETTIQNSLSYLNATNTPEIAWIEINGNNVYIGFSKRTPDVSMIIKGAALKCNKAINFGCHVWAVPADAKRPWKPGSGPFYDEATARGGKIQ